MSKKEKSKRRVFNLYNMAVLFCLILIIGSIIALFETRSDRLPKEWTEKYAEVKTTIANKFEELTSKKEDKTSIASTNANKENIKIEQKEKTNSNQNENNTSQVKTNEENQVNETNVANTNNITVKQGDANETAAKLIALNKFKELGETDITENNLQVINIQRQEQEYYYITSPKNSMEIEIATGKITRVNSIPVQE